MSAEPTALDGFPIAATLIFDDVIIYPDGSTAPGPGPMVTRPEFFFTLETEIV
jgi:hypothetical protein